MVDALSVAKELFCKQMLLLLVFPAKAAWELSKSRLWDLRGFGNPSSYFRRCHGVLPGQREENDHALSFMCMVSLNPKSNLSKTELWEISPKGSHMAMGSYMDL